MLELRHIGKSYANGRQVLTDLSYTLVAGEYVAIMGESGVGKSTLLNLIAGLDAPDTGKILIDGVAISSLDDDAATGLRRKEFGFVFQAFHVLPHLTLSQNIALPLLLNSVPVEHVMGRTAGGIIFHASFQGANCNGSLSHGRSCIAPN